MKKSIVMLVVFAVSLFSSAILCAEIKVSRFTGSVMVFQNNNWVPVTAGMSLAAQDLIKTDQSGKAELIMDDTSRIWITENSQVKVGWLGQESLLDLVVGKIRAKLKLGGGKTFSVKTPVSVVAVRGTEFVADDAGSLFVLDGVVKFSNAAGTANSDVPAGQFAAIDQSGAIPPPANITPEQQATIEKDWSSFENMKTEGASPTPDEQKEAAKEKLKTEMTALKQELRDTVVNMKSDVDTAREIVNEIKESDFSTGRSMKDVHGNLVRIEQHMMRPDSQTLQFVNLTKRDGYIYRGQFSYSGPSTNRIDIFDANITFNKKLPEQLTDWPSFISGQDKDEFYPQSVDVKLTNQADTLEMKGVSREAGQLDEKGQVLTSRSIVSDVYVNGWKVDPNYDTQDMNRPEYDPADKGISETGEKTDDLWATGISPKMKLDQIVNGVVTNTEYVKLYVEGYTINNDGKILNLKDFTSSNENPFSLLKKVGAEGIISCKTTLGNDFFTRGNIDIIMTPDIVVAIAQKLGSELTTISDNVRNTAQ